MATPTALLYDTGAPAANVPSIPDAGTPADHAMPHLFSNPLLDRLEQQQQQAAARPRLHRRPCSTTNRRTDPRSRRSQD
eukprot:7334657-Pyramimonas_sp.AAC.1